MSIHGPRKSTIGLDHSGKPHAGAFVPLDHPKAQASHPHAIPKAHSGMEDVTNTTATLGKAPKPKRAHMAVPPMHSGMNAMSRRDGTHFHGLSGQDISRYDANGPDPLSGAPRGKTLTPVQPSPGMRSRVGETDNMEPGIRHAKGKPDVQAMRDLGKAILAEATCAPDDRAALADWGIGTLPPVVRSN